MNTLEENLRLWLREDIGHGDVSTLLTVPPGTMGKGRFLMKEDGVICGLGVVAKTFNIVDEKIEVKSLIQEGEAVKNPLNTSRCVGSRSSMGSIVCQSRGWSHTTSGS